MGKEAVPLRAVRDKLRPVVDALPQLLDIDHVLADRGLRAGLLLQVMGGREMVGMRMRVEDPFHRQVIVADVAQDLVRTLGCRRARLLVEIEHGIDDGAFAGLGIGDDVLDAPRAFVEEALDLGTLRGAALQPGCGGCGIEPSAAPELDDLFGRHAPIQSLSDQIEVERARTSLAMGNGRTLGRGHRPLKGPDIRLGDGLGRDRDEGIGQAALFGFLSFHLAARLRRLFVIRPVVDQRPEPPVAEQANSPDAWLRRHR